MKVLRLFFINIIVFCGLIGLLYAALWVWDRSGRSDAGPALRQEYSHGFSEPDPQVGFQGMANLITRGKETWGDQVLYDVEYRFDEHHRRVVPQEFSQAPDKHLVFLGASNLFGQGVPADQSLPYYLGQAFPQSKVYNYAFPGWGPNNSLALVETSRLAEEVAEPEGFSFYFFSAGYADRLLGTTEFFKWADGSHPYYRFEKGRLHRSENFARERPWYTQAQRWLASSLVNRFFKINWPNSYSQASMEKLCASFLQIQEGVHKNLPHSQFKVVLWLNMHGKEKDLIHCLKTKKIPYVFLSEKVPKTPEREIHEQDQHLNGQGHRDNAAALVEALSHP